MKRRAHKTPIERLLATVSRARPRSETGVEKLVAQAEMLAGTKDPRAIDALLRARLVLRDVGAFAEIDGLLSRRFSPTRVVESILRALHRQKLPLAEAVELLLDREADIDIAEVARGEPERAALVRRLTRHLTSDELQVADALEGLRLLGAAEAVPAIQAMARKKRWKRQAGKVLLEITRGPSRSGFQKTGKVDPAAFRAALLGYQGETRSMREIDRRMRDDPRCVEVALAGMGSRDRRLRDNSELAISRWYFAVKEPYENGKAFHPKDPVPRLLARVIRKKKWEGRADPLGMKARLLKRFPRP